MVSVVARKPQAPCAEGTSCNNVHLLPRHRLITTARSWRLPVLIRSFPQHSQANTADAFLLNLVRSLPVALACARRLVGRARCATGRRREVVRWGSNELDCCSCKRRSQRRLLFLVRLCRRQTARHAHYELQTVLETSLGRTQDCWCTGSAYRQQ